MLNVIKAIMWTVAIGGGIYIPFIRSPELTHSQLFINYWWFYVPMIIVMAIIINLKGDKNENNKKVNKNSKGSQQEKAQSGEINNP